MRLSALPIISFNSVNSFCTGNQWIIRSGDSNTLYFELIDLDQSCGQNNCPSRYIAGVGAANMPTSLLVTFMSIDCSNVIQLPATQNTSDGSIWSVYLSPTQRPFGGAVKFVLTEGTSTKSFSVVNMLCVENVNAGSDGSLQDYGTYSYYPSYGED
jgi:hypothetical protein